MLLLRFAFFNNMLLLRFGLLILSLIQWDLSFVEWKMTPSWPCLDKKRSFTTVGACGNQCIVSLRLVLRVIFAGMEMRWSGNGISTQGPHSHILMTGGSDRGSYFIPKKPQLQNLSTQKNHYFFSIPKKSLGPLSATQKNLSVFLSTQKNHGVFHRPKRITLGQNFRPKKITRTPPPPSVKYVSGVPGDLY